MKTGYRFLNIIFTFSFLILNLSAGADISAQEQKLAVTDRDTLLSVAKEYIQSVRYCVFVTVDSTDNPHARVMDPFKPDHNMVIWLGTNRYSRKVQEVRRNPNVNLLYYDDKGTGYVSVIGKAFLIDAADKKAEFWKPEWERFYNDRNDYILIKVIPEKLEVLNYQRGIYGDPKTWKTPSVDFDKAEKKE